MEDTDLDIASKKKSHFDKIHLLLNFSIALSLSRSQATQLYSPVHKPERHVHHTVEAYLFICFSTLLLFFFSQAL